MMFRLTRMKLKIEERSEIKTGIEITKKKSRIRIEIKFRKKLKL